MVVQLSLYVDVDALGAPGPALDGHLHKALHQPVLEPKRCKDGPGAEVGAIFEKFSGRADDAWHNAIAAVFGGWLAFSFV